jgi:hypothetical protein
MGRERKRQHIMAFMMPSGDILRIYEDTVISRTGSNNVALESAGAGTASKLYTHDDDCLRMTHAEFVTFASFMEAARGEGSDWSVLRPTGEFRAGTWENAEDFIRAASLVQTDALAMRAKADPEWSLDSVLTQCSPSFVQNQAESLHAVVNAARGH